MGVDVDVACCAGAVGFGGDGYSVGEGEVLGVDVDGACVAFSGGFYRYFAVAADVYCFWGKYIDVAAVARGSCAGGDEAVVGKGDVEVGFVAPGVEGEGAGVGFSCGFGEDSQSPGDEKVAGVDGDVASRLPAGGSTAGGGANLGVVGDNELAAAYFYVSRLTGAVGFGGETGAALEGEGFGDDVNGACVARARSGGGDAGAVGYSEVVGFYFYDAGVAFSGGLNEDVTVSGDADAFWGVDVDVAAVARARSGGGDEALVSKGYFYVLVVVPGVDGEGAGIRFSCGFGEDA